MSFFIKKRETGILEQFGYQQPSSIIPEKQVFMLNMIPTCSIMRGVVYRNIMYYNCFYLEMRIIIGPARFR